MIIFECEVSPDSLRSGGMAPGADIRTTVLQVPMRYRKLGEIDGVTNIGIFEEVRMIDLRGLAKLKEPRTSIHAFSASNGLSVGSIPSARAARCTLVVAIVRIRRPFGYPLIRSNNSAGQSGSAAVTSVMPPISR